MPRLRRVRITISVAGEMSTSDSAIFDKHRHRAPLCLDSIPVNLTFRKATEK